MFFQEALKKPVKVSIHGRRRYNIYTLQFILYWEVLYHKSKLSILSYVRANRKARLRARAYTRKLIYLVKKNKNENVRNEEREILLLFSSFHIITNQSK